MNAIYDGAMSDSHTVETLLGTVTEIPAAVILEQNRNHTRALARQAVIAHLRLRLNWTVTRTAEALNRNHATISYSVAHFRNLLEVNDREAVKMWNILEATL